jgi:hypothetical protein
MNFKGIPGRIVLAILVGVLTFIVMFIIGVIAAKYDAEIGNVLKSFSALIGLLAGLFTFFTGRTPTV